LAFDKVRVASPAFHPRSIGPKMLVIPAKAGIQFRPGDRAPRYTALSTPGFPPSRE
jgi:hypothetical protein